MEKCSYQQVIASTDSYYRGPSTLLLDGSSSEVIPGVKHGVLTCQDLTNGVHRVLLLCGDANRTPYLMRTEPP